MLLRSSFSSECSANGLKNALVVVGETRPLVTLEILPDGDNDGLGVLVGRFRFSF